MNELMIMSTPDAARPYYIYDKTLRRAVSKNDYQSYELAELALQDYLQTGKYFSKEKHPDASGQFNRMVKQILQDNDASPSDGPSF